MAIEFMLPELGENIEGGDGQPNYEKPEVLAAAERLSQAGLAKALMVDCSHANANKVAINQLTVWNSIIEQRKEPDCAIIGAMVESFIEADNQKIVGEKKYGLSITDPCIDWPTTEAMLLS